MNYGQQYILVKTQTKFLVCVLAVMILVLPNIGCRQPASNSQSALSSIFDLNRSRLFNGNSSFGSPFANNSSQQATSIASRIFGGGNSNSGGFGGTGFGNVGGFGNVAGGAFGSNVNNAGGFGGAAGQIQNQQNFASIANEVQNLNQRLGAYDSDNQLLNTEVAALKQKLQLANQYNQTLKQQLADNSGRIQQSELEKQSAFQQLASAQMQMEQFRSAQNENANQFNNRTEAANSNGATRFGTNGQGQLAGFGGGGVPSTFGGATIRANNSLMNRLSSIRIPGGQARMDGDVIRVEFPSDRMFVPGSYQIQPAQLPLLQNIARTIRQSFPKQIIGIEAHWDNTPLNPPSATDHQLTATQSLAVFENLVKLGLPKNQLFTMAMASNRPRHPQGVVNGVSPNRRIELVIYPETYDGSF